MFFFCNHFGFSSSRFETCTLALPFTFSLLIPGPTHSRRPPFVIRRLALLYTARLYSRTHCLAFSPSYLACRYFAVFSLSSNIDFDTSRVPRSSRSLTRLGPCKGCMTASKALLRLQHFRAKHNSLASDPKPALKTSRTLCGTFPRVGHSRVHLPLRRVAAQPRQPLRLAASSNLRPPFEPMTDREEPVMTRTRKCMGHLRKHIRSARTSRTLHTK